MGAGEAPVVPAGARIEFAQQDEELIRGRLQATGQRSDRFSELGNIVPTLGGRRIIANGFQR
jgi:hypothetical protein